MKNKNNNHQDHLNRDRQQVNEYCHEHCHEHCHDHHQQGKHFDEEYGVELGPETTPKHLQHQNPPKVEPRNDWHKR